MDCHKARIFDALEIGACGGKAQQIRPAGYEDLGKRMNEKRIQLPDSLLG
jgi:hypothetical protein